MSQELLCAQPPAQQSLPWASGSAPPKETIPPRMQMRRIHLAGLVIDPFLVDALRGGSNSRCVSFVLGLHPQPGTLLQLLQDCCLSATHGTSFATITSCEEKN